MTSIEHIGQIAEADLRVWSPALHATKSAAKFSHLLDMVGAERGCVYTGRFPKTRNFCNAIADRNVSVIGGSVRNFTFIDCIDVFATLLTFSRLARAGAGQICKPGLWVRNEGDRANALLPVMPIGALAEVTARPERELRAMIAPMIQDGAVRAIQCPDGSTGFMAQPGYADDGVSRSFLKV